MLDGGLVLGRRGGGRGSTSRGISLLGVGR